MNEQIKINYGCTQPLSFLVEDTDGNPIDLTDGEYTLFVGDQKWDFEVKGEDKNQVHFIIQGRQMLPYGTYSVTLYKNKGGLWQMRLCMRDCIKII